MIRRHERKQLSRFKPGWRWLESAERWVTYEADFMDPATGLRVRKRGFLTEEEAKAHIRDVEASARLKALGLAPDSTRRFPAVAELFDRKLATVTERKNHALRERVFRVFGEMLPPGFRLDELRQMHFRDYADMRRAGAKPVRNETVNRELAAVSAVLREAHLFYPALEGWTPPKVPSLPERREGRKRVISDDEARRLIEWLARPRVEGQRLESWAARVRTALILEFALMTGCRHSEICSIRKDDALKDPLPVLRSKTNTWTFFPRHPAMDQILEQAAALSKSEWVFSSRGKMQGKTWKILRAACETLGIEYGRYSETGLILHSSRHTFVSKLATAGVDIATIKSFSGHASTKVLMNYAHTNEESRRRVVEMFGKRESEGDALRDLYDAVRSGKMTFEEFAEAILKCR